MKIEVEQLNWNKMNNIIPAIIQDSKTLQVLMLGYMNQHAMEQTCSQGKVTFYSRSKNRLWQKGETSGNELMVEKIAMDCDGDTLLILVQPLGSVCHLNTFSCFGESQQQQILIQLENKIAERYEQRPINSYVSQLFGEGIKRIAQKVGEEGVEVALAGVGGSRTEVVNESADLIFHLLVMLKQRDIAFDEVLDELSQRL
jgi:phosphoribosyl-ATP pyrophosphohydrolase/phosphoribosyl-AMP cyclohydrolase